MKIELICQCCNKPFETEFKFRDKKFCSRNCYFQNARQGKTKIGRSKDETIRETRECKVCGKEFEVKKKQNKQMCSDECRVKWGNRDDVKQKRLDTTKKTVQEKYGVDHIWQVKEIHQKTMENRDMGVVSTKVSESLKSKTDEEKKDILEKRKITKEKIYGNPFYNNPNKISNSLKVSYLVNGDTINEKREKTMLTKYGVTSSLQLDITRVKLEEIRDEVTKKGVEVRKAKYIEYLKSRLEDNNLCILSEYDKNKEGTKSIEYEFKCLKCDNIFTSTVLGSGKIPICRKCNPTFTETHISNKIKEVLDLYSINYIQNDRRLINPYELDFYLPEHNLAFEINGNYYHSEIGGGKDKFYHIDKTKLANHKNVKVIQLYEDEIIQNFEIVKSKILHFIGKQENKIYARKCVLKLIDNKTSRKFLDENHLQGNSKSSVKLGLYHQDKLVSVMTFSKGRVVTSNSGWELIRFCNKKYTSVIGSFNKLLNYFTKNYEFDELITYCDIRWSGIKPEDTVYYKNNLKFVGFTPPSYWYMDRKNYNYRLHRFNFRKSKLVSEGFDVNKTEWDIMKERGFDRIWDCGTMKFIYNK
jgi:predicted NAD-dependent protein-ADP-ribosyltransferase YbiA (DUF1768 family)